MLYTLVVLGLEMIQLIIYSCVCVCRYVGNLPVGVTTDQIMDFLNAVMRQCGAVTGSDMAVLSAWIAGDGKYSFVEFASPDCATIAMGNVTYHVIEAWIKRMNGACAGLDGVAFNGTNLRIKRPNTYAEHQTAALPGVPMMT